MHANVFLCVANENQTNAIYKMKDSILQSTTKVVL